MTEQKKIASKRKQDVRRRELKIMELANANTPQEVIAEILNLSPSTVSKTIKRCLDRYTSIEVDVWRQERLARLDALATTFYPRGRQGDEKASAEYRKLDEAMARYVPGLEVAKQHDLNVTTDEHASRALSIIEELLNTKTSKEASE